MLRRLYDWVLQWAETPYGVPALAILAFTESSFFPIPPDVLLIALTLSIPSNGVWYATVCSVASVVGGMFGYLIGWAFWEAVKGFFFTYVFSEAVFNQVGEYYADNAFLYIFTAAFTPIPYKVFTIAAGVWHDRVSLMTLVLASALGRPLRFFLVAGLIQIFGNPIKQFIDKYFDFCSLGFVGLLVLGFIVIKWL
ncbi:MAG TPA: DedA family protein [Alphaproteobacteria bacterium]|nr:DedA family protein [Alphaproteobacteria bacterium]